MFEVFEHTADLGLRIKSPDLPTLMSDAGRAFLSLIVANPDDVRSNETMAFEIQGTELDYLLFDWLNELLYTFDSKRLLFSGFDIRMSPTGFDATARGETADPSRHHMEREIKAITYHGLRVEQQDDEWIAEVILDI
jgi:SHS2 domain-containing protein